MSGDTPYLVHMREAILQINLYTRGGRDAFFADRLVQDAVIRNLKVIGEAAKHVSAATRARATAVPWRRIA